MSGIEEIFLISESILMTRAAQVAIHARSPVIREVSERLGCKAGADMQTLVIDLLGFRQVSQDPANVSSSRKVERSGATALLCFDLKA